ncbi:latent-transforming growth factor beta-binding protein 1-like isoform X2 [Mytilus edulis]|uniref:latent-transforming growth factor beta-binding protein 1-like isoform X2 n=1 Tax=Mytilus edulis TaxID=6550 RepID=UPI0039F12614
MLFVGVIAVVLMSKVSATTNCEQFCKHLSSHQLRYENCLWDCGVVDDCKKCEAPRCEDKPDACNAATEKCRDTDNGRVCDCKDGFEKKDGQCVDIDECATKQDTCDRSKQICENLPGSFKCTYCPDGKVPVNNECIDIDECATKQDNCIRSKQVCENLPGSFKCIYCPAGKVPVNNECIDIDECATKQDNCDRSKQICENLPGSFKCIYCTAGKVPVNNECIVKTCQHHVKCGEHQECKQTINGPKCECVNGHYYTVNGCKVKTCAHHACKDNQVCKNTDYGPKCECQQGYYYHENACKASTKCPHVKCRYNEYCYKKTGKCYLCKVICKQYTEGTYMYKSCYSFYCNGDYGR